MNVYISQYHTDSDIIYYIYFRALWTSTHTKTSLWYMVISRSWQEEEKKTTITIKQKEWIWGKHTKMQFNVYIIINSNNSCHLSGNAHSQSSQLCNPCYYGLIPITVNVISIDCFYIPLFSALQQTHHTLVACKSEWMSIAFFQHVLNIYVHQSGVLTQLEHYLVVMWLVLHETAAVSAHILCTPYSHVPVYIVTSCKATYVAPGYIHVCSAVTCHPHFLTEWPGSFMCCCGNA